MRSRRLVLGLIILTLLATGLAAAAKLRATPKYDRVQVGMTKEEARSVLGGWETWKYSNTRNEFVCECDEGQIYVMIAGCDDNCVVEKQIIRRGPWNVSRGWRAGADRSLGVEHMLRRWHFLVLIAVVLLATCLASAVKLRATPKYDRVQVGMEAVDAAEVFGQTEVSGNLTGYGPWRLQQTYECDEGSVVLNIIVSQTDKPGMDFIVESKSITRRGPLERLAWLAGWR